MPDIPLTPDQVANIAAQLSDTDRLRVRFTGTALSVPDDLVAAIATMNVNTTPQSALIEYAANARWRKEIGGVTVSGVPVATDDRSKQMIMGARIAATADPNFTTTWVGSDGNAYPLNATQIIAISNAVLAHVNACFTEFVSVKDQITSNTIINSVQIDAAFAAVTT